VELPTYTSTAPYAFMPCTNSFIVLHLSDLLRANTRKMSPPLKGTDLRQRNSGHVTTGREECALYRTPAWDGELRILKSVLDEERSDMRQV
jgi:hypothetical protein